jgi:hypothetical protein
MPLWDALPDVFSPEWFAAVRDLLSVGLAALGAWLAWLSIKMGREQDAVTVKQMDLMEGQKDLLAELKALEAKQADIAEVQHRMVMEQAARRASLTLADRPMSNDGSKVHLALAIKNGGQSAAEGIYWHVFVDATVDAEVDFQFRRISERVVEGDVVHYRGFADQPIFPTRSVNICSPVIGIARLNQCEIRWQLVCRDGVFPADGQHGAIRVGRDGEVTRTNYAYATFNLNA